MRSAVAVLVAWSLGAAPAAERLFGPETKTGKYKHPACITELSNGDLYIVYYGGDGEYALDTGVFGSRRRKGESRWSEPKLIASDPLRSVGNAVVWEAPDRTVWLFYVVRYGRTWSTSRIQAKLSRDGAQTWSDSFVVTNREGTMVRNKPVVLSTGEYLLPVYHETGQDTEVVGADSTSRFLVFDADSRTWVERGIIKSTKGNVQPGVVEVSKDHLIAYCRRGGGYGKVSDGWAVRSESRDGGRTWTEGVDSSFKNPNSALELLKLANGHLLIIFNDSMYARTPLVAALSTDGDRTWPHRRVIGAAPKQSYAYPSAAQGRDGRIHVVWTGDNRAAIYYTSFEESWLTQAE